jgi:hypothetical protein
MTRRIFALAFTLIACAATTAIAQDHKTAKTPAAVPSPIAGDSASPGLEEGGGVLFGKHFSFEVQAPKGWVFDNQSGVPQGLHAVLYRKGETYENSDSMMYARGSDEDPGHPRTLDQFIAEDLADFRENSPGVHTFDIGSFALKDGTPVRVIGFRGDQWGNVEAVAYVEHGGDFYMLVLTARSQQRFDADLPAFRGFVHSLLPMGRDDNSGG